MTELDPVVVTPRVDLPAGGAVAPPANEPGPMICISTEDGCLRFAVEGPNVSITFIPQPPGSSEVARGMTLSFEAFIASANSLGFLASWMKDQAGKLGVANEQL